MSATIDSLVLTGGGAKGIAYLGVFKALEDLGITKDIKYVSGSSIGSMFSLMFALGYTYTELHDYVTQFSLDNFKDSTNIPFAEIYDIIKGYGIYKGQLMEDEIKRLISEKGHPFDISFSDLLQTTDKYVVVSTVEVNTKTIRYFNPEDTPDFPIWKAVKASMAIPLLFKPVEIEGKLHVDGGVGDNTPVNGIKEHGSSPLITVFNNNTVIETNITDIKQFIIALTESIITIPHSLVCARPEYEDRIITINTEGVGLLDFDASTDQKEKIIRNAYYQTLEIIQGLCMDQE